MTVQLPLADTYGMLTFEQIKSIENALGEDKAGPVIQALETVEERVKSSMVQELATKQDIHELQRDIEELRLASQKDLKELEAGLKHDIEELRLASQKDLKEVEAGLKHDNMALEVKLVETKADLLRWMAGMLIAQAAVIAALVKLL